MRLLVVEDDPHLGPNLKKGLEKHHSAVDLAEDGEDAVVMGMTTTYDLIMLDVLLPSCVAKTRRGSQRAVLRHSAVFR